MTIKNKKKKEKVKKKKQHNFTDNESYFDNRFWASNYMTKSSFSPLSYLGCIIEHGSISSPET